jgi:preprotein translocase subunit SecG
MGAAFGSGASGSLFGATGSANFLSRTTGVLATIFFITSLTLAYMGGKQTRVEGGSVMDAVKIESPAAPAAQPADDSKAKEIPK